MKRVIVTGGTGFIGSNLARRLLTEGHQVHLLVRPGYSPRRIQTVRKELHIHQVDFLDAQALKEAVKRIRPDWIFHLAASGAYSWQNDLTRMVETNIISTINLVEACLSPGFEAFINTGSSSEYGYKTFAPAETEWLEPNSHYAVTKASASLFCRYTAQSHNLGLYTLRLYSVYGPYEEPQRLMPTLIRYGMKGELPPLVGPETARDYIYIEDVLEAFLLAATHPDQEVGAVYNIGSGIQISLREVVDIARRIMELEVEPAWGTMPQRSWDTNHWVADNRKAQDELGWRVGFSFQDGFRRMVEWFRHNPEYLDRDH
jgi:UDP-glucose 4-epimerase